MTMKEIKPNDDKPSNEKSLVECCSNRIQKNLKQVESQCLLRPSLHSHVTSSQYGHLGG